MNYYPRILILSNNCFSESSSNGRTLGGFFQGWPIEKIAQFYISGNNPNFNVCNNYFKVSDKDALNSVLRRKKQTDKSELKITNNASDKRNPITMLCRTIVWSTNNWQRYGFKDWVNSFNPELILLQAGDCSFMFRLANNIALERNIKLVIYNSEGYFFKKYNYFQNRDVSRFLYPLFYYDLKRALNAAYKKAAYVIYNCDELRNDFNKVFTTPSLTIYTSSDLSSCVGNENKNNKLIISYCGNLGLGRHKELIRIANVIGRISNDLVLDVYGKTSDKKIEDELTSCSFLRYHGFVSYEEVKDIISKSDILVHAESFDAFSVKDLKYAFSTKIADCLSSGRCFLLYAPQEMACSRYLLDNRCAYVATSQETLEVIMKEIIANPEQRTRYISQATKIAHANHSKIRNIEKFQNILSQLIQN